MEIVQMISQMGFPIAVAAWLLVKLEARLDSAEGAARELTAKIQAHMDWCINCQKAVCGNNCEKHDGR
jgi:invasion protein IalB